MTKRCRHEFDTKADYPDDIICHKCGTIWTITEYKDYPPTKLITLPKAIRREVMKRQAEQFNVKFPDYYNSKELL